ncbi:MAG: type II toxin-antitoxin system RelE/ParE family toxin [Gammaproteobacteria bacterium]
MTGLRITRAARGDIKRILRRSETDFGEIIRNRYKALLNTAMADIAHDPQRQGVRAIDDVRPGYFVYHTRWSKRNVSGPSIKRLRHLLLFSRDDTTITIAAVVHERELLSKHIAVRATPSLE